MLQLETSLPGCPAAAEFALLLKVQGTLMFCDK